VVKNNILLSVLVASFTAPAFASFMPKKCPLNKEAQFGAAVVAVDVVSSRFTCLPRAVEFHNNQVSSVVKNSSAVASSTVVASSDTVADVSARDNQAVASAAPATQVDSAAKRLVSKVLDTQVSVDLTTVGVDGGVTVKVAPLAAKVALTYVLIEAGKKLVASVYPVKK